jgi:hypothetical protein
MFKLLRINDDEFIIVTHGGKAVYGNRLRIVLALESIGVDFKEIENGIVSLCLNEHHVADYGVNKMFIYSQKLA